MVITSMISEQLLQHLEFTKIREQLATYTSFPVSRQLALSLTPSTDSIEVSRRLQQTSEARRLIDQFPDIPSGESHDVREVVAHALRGGTLEANDFLPIRVTLTSMRRLRECFDRLDPQGFPQLLEHARHLPCLPELEREIAHAIGDDGSVVDSASQTLAHLRSAMRVLEQRIHERLVSLVNSARLAGYLQEPLITVRNGRYVVPVKAAHRRDVAGIVHDQSASGATLYIEPMAVVEMNNQLRKLQLDEEREVNRILTVLSQRVGGVGEQIITGIASLAILDCCFAQARYAITLGAVEPAMVVGENSPSPPLYLKEARHPLIDPQDVVPITVWLGDRCRFLLVTGPNTGGKTVVLKTVGLLALMAQAGLQIPAHACSRLPVFRAWFVDIGDEQSIERNLSTFSSHMTTIIRMLDELEQLAKAGECDQPALVLLDEIGAGTDPTEGVALARAILEHLITYHCLGIATTHYTELKWFAHHTEGICNAAVEFDSETLTPTYTLTIGIPGRSNALAIAARLGFPPQLIERARSHIHTNTINLEDMLADIRQQREAAEQERQRATALRSEAEAYRNRLAEAFATFEHTRQERLEQALASITEEFGEVRAELQRLRKEVRGNLERQKWVHAAAQQLQQLRTRVERLREQQAIENPKDILPAAFQVGDGVLVRSLGLRGEIVSVDAEDHIAEVQIGGFRVQVRFDELQREQPTRRGVGHFRKTNDQGGHRPPAARAISLPAVRRDVPTSFDVRGWRTAEVATGLERYLNDAYLAGLSQVRIIHGKGSGALRQVVHEFLRTHPLVSSFRSGGLDGGEGVSVVSLVER